MFKLERWILLDGGLTAGGRARRLRCRAVPHGVANRERPQQKVGALRVPKITCVRVIPVESARDEADTAGAGSHENRDQQSCKELLHVKSPPLFTATVR